MEKDAARVTIRVQPRARTTRIAGRINDVWKLHLTAPPVDGKANEACLRFLADLAGVGISRAHMVSGFKGRTKVIEIDGIAQHELERRLERQLERRLGS